MREKKFQEHFNFVASRLQKLHKNMMWSMYVGRSFLDNIELVTRAQNEFCINKTVTWSKDIVNHIEDMLRLNEDPCDGLVCLFSVADDTSDRDIDYDKIAWEIEKIAVYNCVATYTQNY